MCSKCRQKNYELKRCLQCIQAKLGTLSSLLKHMKDIDFRHFKVI